MKLQSVSLCVLLCLSVANSQPVSRHASSNNTCGPSVEARGPSNLVEPLSDGLGLTWTRQQVETAFGLPSERSSDPNIDRYPGLTIKFAADGHIREVVLNGCVKLHDGIGAESARDEVEKTFGDASVARYEGSELRFRYSEGRVFDITIRPSSGSAFSGVGEGKTERRHSRQ